VAVAPLSCTLIWSALTFAEPHLTLAVENWICRPTE